MNALIKLCVLILAFMGAYIFHRTIVRPKLLEPHCLVNTNNCAQIEYYKKMNTVFVIVRPSAYRLWYNGSTFYVYDISNSGRTCSNPNYQPAYEIKPKMNNVQNYHCIRSFASVFEEYKNVPKRVIFIRSEDPVSFSVFDVIRHLLEEKIIQLES